MKRSDTLRCTTAICIIALSGGCAKRTSDAVAPSVLQAFSPLPDVATGKEPITTEKVALGRMLYYDGRFESAWTGAINEGAQRFPFFKSEKRVLCRGTISSFGVRP